MSKPIQQVQDKPVILTGIRANNDLHIGNYFGALLPIVDMARQKAGEYQINLFVPDLHSFTTPIDHSKLYEQTIHNLKLFVAAGLPLDHDDIHIYRQSFVPAHSELTWILDCFTGFGEMSRMTAFKEKKRLLATGKIFVGNVRLNDPMKTASEDIDMYVDSKVTVGLFNYPVLMACDILLYGATYVPVGDDQSQHLEFTRDIAERMNSKFSELFTVPKPVKEQHEFFGKDQGLRIKDLVDPTKKMSKSDASERGIIFLGDNPDEAAKKIMGATTDSLNRLPADAKERDEQPGIANLMLIKTLLTGNLNLPEANTQGYAFLKQQVAEDVKAFLTDFQSKLAQVDEQALMAKLETSESSMNEVANATLAKVQKAVGLRQ